MQEALDRGLEAVQLLHTEYSEMLYRLRSTREVRTDRSRVAFSLGTVFTHKKFGYRGVLFDTRLCTLIQQLLVFWSHNQSHDSKVCAFSADKPRFARCPWQVWCMDGTRSVRGMPPGLLPCMQIPSSPSITCSLTKVCSCQTLAYLCVQTQDTSCSHGAVVSS